MDHAGIAVLRGTLAPNGAVIKPAAASKDLDATALLVTTEEQVKQTVAGVAEYGGSLDVIIDDAT